MKNNQIENRPIPNILSLFPKDENFADTREVASGAWISNNAWEKINSIFSLSQNDEAVQVAKEIKEENPGNVEGIFLTENHFAVIEKNVSYQLQKLSAKTAPKETKKETLEQRLMKESPYLRLLAQRAKEKRASEVKKD